ncbi:MAG: hypothetical protein AMXMBFR23_04330 [Chloroflexota bacterium]
MGGVVRDVAIGRPVHDLDVAIAAGPGPFVQAVAAALHDPTASIEVTDRFGTASVTGGGMRLDLARLRTEHYVSPGALPVVRATARIEVDLERRDFSVNAIALGLGGPRRGEVVDPHGGLADLATRTLRVLHDRSFEDDATRLYRGARTAALFDLRPDAETAALIAEGGRWLTPVSGERLRAEWATTARRGRAGRTLALLDAWGVLRATHPSLYLHPHARRALARRRGAIAPEVLAGVVLAPLLGRAAVLDRLAAPREWRLAADGAAALLDATDPTPEALERLAGTSAAARTAAAWLDPERQRALQRDLRRWERTRPPLTAEALLRLGVARGPALGAALAELRRARFLGTLGSAAEARAEIRRRIAREGG